VLQRVVIIDDVIIKRRVLEAVEAP